MPAGAKMNVQLDQLAKRMYVLYFRTVFMRNALPISSTRALKTRAVS